MCDSASLEEHSRDFAKFVRHLERQNSTTLWPELTRRDAPRVLGEVFQAVVAAVFLDSDWNVAPSVPATRQDTYN